MPAIEQSAERAERRFARTVLLLVGAGFLILVGVGLVAGLVVARTGEHTAWVDHTYEVERQVGGIRLALEEMRSARRGAVLGFPGEATRRYPEAARAFFAGIDSVAALTRDNPAQRSNVARVRVLGRELDARFRQSLDRNDIRSPIEEEARQRLARRLEAFTERMIKEERQLLGEREAKRAASMRMLFIVLAAAAVLLALVGTGSIWVIRRYAHDLNRSRSALRALNQNLEEAVAERTVELQRANEEIQRFAYIVSHDLRSPLVNVMGFTAELEAAIKPLQAFVDEAHGVSGQVAEETRRTVEEDLPEAISFIRTSTQKMDRLINAILRLSREGRRPITPERLDMDQLAQGVVATLRHRIDELGVDVRIAPGLPTIVSDRLAVEQILSNLVENAVKYLRPDIPGLIHINGKVQTGRAIITVEDNGRGVDARDHERIFDLFRRSGAQDRPGEGIGLAHVRALAYRLGGTISVASELGQGATFTINLPVMFAGEKGAAE